MIRLKTIKELDFNSMEERMNRHRKVNKLSKIIDLLNHHSAKRAGKNYVRVRYDYDALENHEEYTVLNNDIPKESVENIILWLKQNVKPEEMINGIQSNCLDVETYNISKKAA